MVAGSVKRSSNIRILLQTETMGVSGVVGNYEVSLKGMNGDAIEETVGEIVIATGAAPFKPEGMFGYGDKKVITQDSNWRKNFEAARRWALKTSS